MFLKYKAWNEVTCWGLSVGHAWLRFLAPYDTSEEVLGPLGATSPEPSHCSPFPGLHGCGLDRFPNPDVLLEVE